MKCKQMIYAPAIADFDRRPDDLLIKKYGNYGIGKHLALYPEAEIIDCTDCFYCENGEWCGAEKKFVNDGVLYCNFYMNNDKSDGGVTLANAECNNAISD